MLWNSLQLGMGVASGLDCFKRGLYKLMEPKEKQHDSMVVCLISVPFSPVSLLKAAGGPLQKTECWTQQGFPYVLKLEPNWG